MITGLLNTRYTPGQMTYGLRRLRLAGPIHQIEHTNRYVLTPDGIRFAVFYAKLHNRLLRPLMAADQAQAPRSYARPWASSASTSMTTSAEHASGSRVKT